LRKVVPASTSVTIGVLRRQGGRIAEENRHRSPTSASGPGRGRLLDRRRLMLRFM
jgi:hypothetical protein